MADLETLVNVLHVDPETLPNVPSAPYGWVGFHGPPAGEPIVNQDPNSWDMPKEVREDKDVGATARRVAWLMVNRPDVSPEKMTRVMALHDDEIAEARELVRYEETQAAYFQSPDADPEHPKVYFECKAGEIKDINPEILRFWTDPEVTDRIITLIDDRLRFSAPDTEGEFFVFWRKSENAKTDELELDAAWFPQREVA